MLTNYVIDIYMRISGKRHHFEEEETFEKLEAF